jgi:hypothetical protein
MSFQLCHVKGVNPSVWHAPPLVCTVKPDRDIGLAVFVEVCRMTDGSRERYRAGHGSTEKILAVFITQSSLWLVAFTKRRASRKHSSSKVCTRRTVDR